LNNTPPPQLTTDKITIEYDILEDRLLFHCGLQDQTSASFYITLRLTRLLIQHLFADRRLHGLADALNTNQSTALRSQEAVPPETATDDSQGTPESTTRRSDSGSKYVFSLLQRCDVAPLGSDGITLKFDLTERSRACFVVLQLPFPQLVQFLNALRAQTLKAGWPETIWTVSAATQEAAGSLTVH